MSGVHKIHSQNQLPNDWVPPRELTFHWDNARDAIGEMLCGDSLGENRLPGTPLAVPLMDVYLVHSRSPSIEQAVRIINSFWSPYSIVGSNVATWANCRAFPARFGSSSIVVSDFRPVGLQAFSSPELSSIEERFSGEMWCLIPRPSELEMALIDEGVRTAMRGLSEKMLPDDFESLRERYGNAVWLSRVCERLMDPSVTRDKHVNRTMGKISDAMLMLVGSLINGVVINSDGLRRAAALNVLNMISPTSFVIHDNLLIGVFDMLDKAMRNPKLDVVMYKASLAAKLGRELGKQRPDVVKRAADILFEAMAIVHGDFVGLNASNADDRVRLEDYDAQMARLMGMCSRMAEGVRHLEGARGFFASLQQNARTESVKAAAGLFASNISVPSYSLLSSSFIHR